MKKRILIVANGFRREEVRLQPWRYLYEIAMALQKHADVVVVTDGGDSTEEQMWPEGFRVVRTPHLSIGAQKQLACLLSGFKPDQLWWSVTPRTVAYWPLLKSVPCRKFALVTCPLYSYGQLMRASLAGVPFKELGALWKQRLIPRWLFAMALRGGVFSRIFTQSESNRKLLAGAGVQNDRLAVLRVGIDAEDASPVANDILEERRSATPLAEGGVTLLYFGALRRIRGFDALVEAFSEATKQAPEMNLVVLARGADDEMLASVKQRLARAKLNGNVHVIGGWLTREQVWAHIELSDIVVLPFVIVPSDVPIAILEAMARGKPVIGSPIDGIPELISGRGVVVDPLDAMAFAGAMKALAVDRDRRLELGENARSFMREYPRWDEVGRQVASEAGLG